MTRKPILIAGPTASGKTAMALRLAERCNGVLINADSMQVYRDLRILSARPSAVEEAGAPHWLFGHIDGAINYSVGLWLQDVGAALVHARTNDQTPIVVGGTGMYFKALTQGLSIIPLVPDAVRRQVRAQSAGLSAQALHARLAAVDPAMAAVLRPTDPQRILRALEVQAATGRSLSEFQATRSAPLLALDACEAMFLSPDRHTLKARIDTRFDAMLAAGALKEVQDLMARMLDPALPVMRAHGVPALMAFLRGEMTRDEAIFRGKADTRAYARRQHTFAKHQLKGFMPCPV